MYIFYEDNCKFKIGSILSETQSSVYLESQSNTKIKVKHKNILFRFQTQESDIFLEKAEQLSQDLDIQLLWECSPQEVFDVSSLAFEYFGHIPKPLELASLLICLNKSAIYFYKRGNGKYRAASREHLEQALNSIKKREEQKLQQKTLSNDMVNGKLPLIILKMAEDLLTKPDKSSIQWKALEGACKQLKSKPQELLLSLGAWPNSLTLMKKCFLKKTFPNGTEFPKLPKITKIRELPVSSAEIYSIDNINTTEVDDALSVDVCKDGNMKVGIHISAPGLAIAKDSEYDQIARNRLLTIYIPGEKITMQPPSVIKEFSLDAGRSVPSLSLYVIINPKTGEVIESKSKLEKIIVKENLRSNFLETIFTRAALENFNLKLPYEKWIRPLWILAKALSKRRFSDKNRRLNRFFLKNEYEFFLDGDPNNPETIVKIIAKDKESPINLIVSEFMILTNTIWGELLRNYSLPGIYRSQKLGKTQMSTKPLPHQGIGAPQYIWSTSPLRRYIDLVNQWQLIAAVDYGISAPLIAPFRKTEKELSVIIEAFESKYTDRSYFQNTMERYWCFRWLNQNDIKIIRAQVLKTGFVQLIGIPLVTSVSNLPTLERGCIVEVNILRIDEINLKIDCSYVQKVSK